MLPITLLTVVWWWNLPLSYVVGAVHFPRVITNAIFIGRGFWVDIRVGPFITFGVDCDRPNAYAEELFAVLNKGTGTFYPGAKSN